MDFLPKTANLQGGDTRQTPKNTQFSKSRHTPEGKGPPHAITHIPIYHPQTLSILSNPNTPKYLLPPYYPPNFLSYHFPFFYYISIYIFYHKKNIRGVRGVRGVKIEIE